MKNLFERLRSLRTKDSVRSLAACDVLLCCHDVDRGDTLNGQAYSRLIDSVTDELVQAGWICAQFAHPPSVLVGNKAWGKPASANRRLFWGAFLLRLYCLAEKVGIRLSRKTVNWLKSHELRFYDELFERTQCRVVITIGAPAAMCSAAHSRNLLVIELLHGIGYAQVPWGWDRQDQAYLPKGILSLDDVSTQTFSALSVKGIVVKQIPHPWFKRFADPELRRNLPTEWKVAPKWLLAERRKKVLLSLQWGYDGELEQHLGILPNGVMHEEVLRAIEVTQGTVLWLIRLHPVQLRKSRYSHHRTFLHHVSEQYNNCEWQHTSTLPLPLLLSHCDGHVTMSSMTTYDAAFLSVPSLLLCPTLKSNGIKHKMFQDLRISRYAELGSFDTQAIVEWAETVSRTSHPFQFDSICDWNSAVEWMLGRASKVH